MLNKKLQFLIQLLQHYFDSKKTPALCCKSSSFYSSFSDKNLSINC